MRRSLKRMALWWSFLTCAAEKVSPALVYMSYASGNLPSGSFIAPMEDGVSGETVIDGSMVGINTLRTPLKQLCKWSAAVYWGEGTENLEIPLRSRRMESAELGIGNSMKKRCSVAVRWRWEGSTAQCISPLEPIRLLAVKIQGDCHMDEIILKPTLYLDGQLVIREGEFVLCQ